MIIEAASKALIAAVSEHIADDMASALAASDRTADLSDRAACFAALEAHGFGRLSIEAVGDLAISKATGHGH